MGYDVLKRKCGAHNRIIGNRETCPQCASDLRAKMGPKPREAGDDRDVQWDAGGSSPKLAWSKPATMDWVPHEPVLPAEVYAAYTIYLRGIDPGQMKDARQFVDIKLGGKICWELEDVMEPGVLWGDTSSFVNVYSKHPVMMLRMTLGKP